MGVKHGAAISNFAVLASGSGTDLQSIIDAVEAGNIKAKITAVVCDRPAFALERAKKHGLNAVLVNRAEFADKGEFDERVFQAITQSGAQAVVLAGYLSIVDKKLIQHYQNKIINIHPSLIPSFCGMGFFGAKVHQAVLDYGCKLTGVTVHFVDEGADTGAIIAQRAVEVREGDTAETLSARVLEVEHRLLPEMVAKLCAGELEIAGRTVKILNSTEVNK